MHLRSPNFIRNTLQKRLNSFYTTSSSIKAKATATSSKIETADNTTNSNAESNRDWNHFENNSSKDVLSTTKNILITPSYRPFHSRFQTLTRSVLKC